MELIIEDLPQKKSKPDFNNLIFGKNYTDRMFIMEYSTQKGWHNAKITNYKDLVLSPATTALHYSQEIFEGMKAYFRNDGKIGLFRPEENLLRLNTSAERLCMPKIDIDFCLKSLYKLLELEKDWIPTGENASLYIRPTMIGTDPMIGLKSSETFLFYIIMSPVGAYYDIEDCGLKLLAEEEYVRACPGGTGAVKTGGNYASSLIAGKKSKKLGYDQALWLDGIHRKYVEEAGTMNIFFVYGNKLKTPALNGSILPGITRKSVIILAKELGLEVEEAALDIKQICQDIQNNKLTEAFGSGTAVVISPVSSIGYQGKIYEISEGKIGNLTKKIYKELTDIQYGKKPDIFNWTVSL